VRIILERRFAHLGCFKNSDIKFNDFNGAESLSDAEKSVLKDFCAGKDVKAAVVEAKITRGKEPKQPKVTNSSGMKEEHEEEEKKAKDVTGKRQSRPTKKQDYVEELESEEEKQKTAKEVIGTVRGGKRVSRPTKKQDYVEESESGEEVSSDVDEVEVDESEADGEDSPPRKKGGVKKRASKKEALPPKRKKAKVSEDEEAESDAESADAPPKKKGRASKKETKKNTKSDESKKETDGKVEDLKEELSSKSVAKLKEMLNLNDMIRSGNKDELAERVADAMVYGAIPRCPQCFGGRLKVAYKSRNHGGQGDWSCPGYHDEDHFRRCSYRSEEVVRPAWKTA